LLIVHSDGYQKLLKKELKGVVYSALLICLQYSVIFVNSRLSEYVEGRLHTKMGKYQNNEL
jgi:hypothetical protein